MVRAPQRQQGFTLIEIMIVVAIVAILSAIALPSYRDYVLRGRLTEAISGLSDVRTKMEQFYADNRTYPTGGCVTSGTPSATQILVSPLQNFTFDCGTPDATTYTIKATGTGPTAGFVYQIKQDNSRSTTVTGVNGWTGNAACWVTRKGGEC